MQNGSFSRFYSTSSIVHFINPLCKILGFLIFLLMAVLCSNFRVICGLFLLLFFLVIISNISLIEYIRPLLRFKLLFLVLFLICLLFGNGLYNSILFVGRICLCFVYYLVLLYTTNTDELLYGFLSLLRPLQFFGISVFKVSVKLVLVFNFVPYLFFEFDRIVKFQKSRGVGFKDGFFGNILFKFKFVFIPSLLLSIRRVCYLRDYMVYNGFCVNSDKNCISSICWNFKDAYLISCHLLVLVFVLIKEVVL